MSLMPRLSPFSRGLKDSFHSIICQIKIYLFHARSTIELSHHILFTLFTLHGNITSFHFHHESHLEKSPIALTYSRIVEGVDTVNENWSLGAGIPCSDCLTSVMLCLKPVQEWYPSCGNTEMMRSLPVNVNH